MVLFDPLSRGLPRGAGRVPRPQFSYLVLFLTKTCQMQWGRTKKLWKNLGFSAIFSRGEYALEARFRSDEFPL